MLLYQPSILRERWIQLQAFAGACALYVLLLLLLIMPLSDEHITMVMIDPNNVPKPVLFMTGKKSSGHGNAAKIQCSTNTKKNIKPVFEKQALKTEKIIEKKEVKKQKNKSKKIEKKIELPQIESPQLVKSEHKKVLGQSKIEKKGLIKPEQKFELQKKQPMQGESKIQQSAEKKKSEVMKTIPQGMASEQVLPAQIEVCSEQQALLEDADYDPALKAQYTLSRAVARVWKQPAVVQKMSVRILVTVNRQGKAEQVVIEEASGIPVYDIAARAAVLRTEFPREFYGKKVALIFGK